MGFSTGRGADRMNAERRPMRNRIGIVVLTVLSGMTPLAAPQAPKATVPRDPEMIDAQGYQKLLEQYRGKPLLVTFWATWCEPCRDEYPMLNELAKQYAPQGLKVDRKSTRLNSSHVRISYAVFCLKKKKRHPTIHIAIAPRDT